MQDSEGWLHIARELAGSKQDVSTLFHCLARGLNARCGKGVVLWITTKGLAAGKYRIEACDENDDGDAGLARLQGQLRSGGMLGDLIDRTEACFHARMPCVPDPVLGEAAGNFAAVFAAPLYDRRVVGGWLVYLAKDLTVHSEQSLTPFALCANLFASAALRSRYVAELREASAWIERELEEVAGIQRALLPDVNPPVPGIRYAASFRAFGRAGGDYYDLVALPPAGEPLSDPGDPSRWGVMIADAAGHGASAAVETAMLDAILRTYSGPSQGPAAVLRYANAHLFTRRIRGSFITAFAANYDPKRRQLIFASAGHNVALLRRATRPVPLERLEAEKGIPLAVLKDATWSDVAVSMNVGDILVLYTDGITETRSPAGQAFGLARLESVVSRSEAEPEAMIRAIEAEVDDFRAGRRPSDDRTVVVVQITRAH